MKYKIDKDWLLHDTAKEDTAFASGESRDYSILESKPDKNEMKHLDSTNCQKAELLVTQQLEPGEKLLWVGQQSGKQLKIIFLVCTILPSAALMGWQTLIQGAPISHTSLLFWYGFYICLVITILFLRTAMNSVAAITDSRLIVISDKSRFWFSINNIRAIELKNIGNGQGDMQFKFSKPTPAQTIIFNEKKQKLASIPVLDFTLFGVKDAESVKQLVLNAIQKLSNEQISKHSNDQLSSSATVETIQARFQPQNWNQFKTGLCTLFTGLIMIGSSYFCPDISGRTMHYLDVIGKPWPDVMCYRSSMNWPTTTGLVKECKTETRKFCCPWENSQYGHVTYAYGIGGKQYQSSNIRSGYITQYSKTEPYEPDFDRSASYVQEHYPIGSPVRVHYDPNNPSTTYLEVGMSDTVIKYSHTLMLLGILAFVLGFWITFFDSKR